MGNKEIEKAREVLMEISQDEHERYLAELRDKYIRDQKAIEGAGYDKGLKDGIEQGIEQGGRKKQIEIAKKMKSSGLDVEYIEKITELTAKEIENL